MLDVQPSPGSLDASDGFMLGELQIEPAVGLITGPGGQEQVDPKVMAVLVQLANKAGELVSRSELLQAIWPSGLIYDDALTQTVYQLRQHLVAAGGNESYRKLLTTLPKRGYQLRGEIRPLGIAAEPATSKQFSVWVPILIMALLAIPLGWWWLQPNEQAQTDHPPSPSKAASLPNTIVVLPFSNDSGNAANDYLIEGLSNELRDRLGALQQWRVVARRSSTPYRDSEDTAQDIGRQLGVSRIVDGRLEQQQDRISITVELVDAASGFQLWSQRYDRATGELLLIQQALGRDLLAQLVPGATTSPEPESATAQQMAAHDLMLLGRQYEQQVTDEQRVDLMKLQRAITLYGQAVETDPTSAEAHARLGRMLLYKGEIPKAEPHILRALELDPQRGDTFTTLGLYYWATREIGIGAAYRRAIELNPSDADALGYYASWAWMQGNATESVEYYRAALELDPLSLLRYADLGYKLAFEGDRHETGIVMDRMLQLFPSAPGYLAAARITEALGDIDEAIAWVLRARELRPDDADVSGQLAELLARIGEFELAARFEPVPGVGQLFWQRRYLELVELGEDLLLGPVTGSDRDLVFLVADAESALGNHSAAIALFESAGFPELVLGESRRANELHAINSYMGALKAIGRDEDARRVAAWVLDWNSLDNTGIPSNSWAPRLAIACSKMVLDDTAAAIEVLETLPRLGTIARLPWLQDWACFAPLQSEPRYQAVVAALQARIGEIRDRLPQTLAQFNVSLPVVPD